MAYQKARIEEVRNVGFVSTRFAGTDGVSLESGKWADVFTEMGFKCFYFAGECDRDPEKSMVVPKAHFHDAEIAELTDTLFSVSVRPPEITGQIHDIKRHLKEKIGEFVCHFDIDFLVIENAVAIPVNLPLGVALTEFVAETGIPAIAHNHDFFWERKRFLRNCAWDFLNMAFPPHLTTVKHVVINSSGQNQLALRTGIAATLIPNVMDYEHPPPEPLFSAAKVREELGLEAGELMILQPTRIVPRKGIEHAVELVHRLNRKAALVISHASGDEGDEYAQRVYDYARMLNVRVIFAGNIIEDRRRQSGQSMIYSLFDIYPHADLVTYPSLFEGFGNAFLEAMYFRKPIVINNYTIYSHDIKPKAFDVIEFDNYINDETMHQIEAVLDNPEKQREMGEANYERAIRHYSYKVLRTKLEDLLEDFFGSSGPKVCGNYQAF